MIKKLKSHLIVCILSIAVLRTEASEIILENGTDEYFINKELEYFYDSTETLTIDDIISKNYSFTTEPFSYVEKKDEKVYWIKFSVNNQRNYETQSWYFESWGFDIDDIEFYIPDKKGGFIRSRMGFARNFSERKIFHKNFLFLIHLSEKEKATYYIRMKRSHAMHLTFLIRTHEVFIKHVVYEYWYLGIFYGIFALIIILNLYLFIVLKDKIYLFYLFCISSEALYGLGRDGMGFQFIWPSVPWLNYITYHNVTQFLLIFFTLLYANQFLQLKKKQPLMYRLSLISIVIKAVMFVCYFIYPVSPFLIFSTDALILSIPLISGILSLKDGNKYVRFYVVAFSCLFLSFILIILEERRILPFMILNYYMINIGMLLEAIFLAIALIDQIRTYRKGYEEAMQKSIIELKEKEQLKDKINQTLELKVEERTQEIQEVLKKLKAKNQELNVANQELEELNDKIRYMNSLLDLDNKKLQTDLTEVSKSRVLAKDVNFEEFQKVFPDENSCLNYLSELKWSNGYQCKKCGYKKATADREHHIMRCKNCNYKESATSDTLFHKLKFPITKAFYLVYLVTVKDKNLTLEELSVVLDLRRETCWSFRKKILLAKEENDKKGLGENDNGWASLALISVNGNK
jgi:hypothetical protein